MLVTVECYLRYVTNASLECWSTRLMLVTDSYTVILSTSSTVTNFSSPTLGYSSSLIFDLLI